MLTRKSTSATSGTRMLKALSAAGGAVDRRTFLRRSGIAAGGLAAVSALSLRTVKKADAAAAAPAGEVKLIKNICTHCSVGCTVTAEVVNGVWISQEPTFESPINLGGHCAKGAAIREVCVGERRLKYPMKLEGGKWQRLSWDQAINEVGDKLLKIRETSGPDSVYWLGSAKFTNEAAYLIRKFAAFWGTNNVDHQARICHSTTVAGVGQTFGFGAMTNSYNDIQNSKCQFIIGSNAAEAHPVSLVHMLKGKETNHAPVIVCDPRFTRTAAHSTEHVRLRPGTDIALIWGILWHTLENGWEDKDFIAKRVYGFDDVRKEVAKYTPDEVERITGVPGAQLKRVAETLAKNRPFTIVWCMGGTQHSVGSANVRAYCILGLAHGTIGTAGGGANIYRGHDNVQGATDMGVEPIDLPAYYPLIPFGWQHWSRVWGVPYDYMVSRFKDKKLMETPGIPESRWHDGVLEKKENVDQPDNLHAMVYWGHAVNSQTRGPDVKKALDKVDLVVVVDPHPMEVPAVSDRKDGIYLFPACSALEQDGSRTASNRSLQWGYKIVNPIFESKTDLDIMYLFAKKFGFADDFFKNIKVDNGRVLAEDVLRELNRGSLTIGYSGQSPERLKLHLEHQKDFDPHTMQAASGPCAGDSYGLPWPCWGKPEHKHPGTPILYDTSKPVKDGGLNFRALFPEDPNKNSTLAEGSFPVGNEIKDGHPQFSYGMLKKLGWDKDLTDEERKTIEEIGGATPDGVLWSNDLSAGIIRVAILHGCAPYGNGKARANVWNFPDAVPTHREPLYAPNRELVAKYPTYTDRKGGRLPILYKSVQDIDFSKDYPIILTSGRLVEFEGGGDETRSNKWLAELQQEMFIEVNPADAAAKGIKNWDFVWVYSPNSKDVVYGDNKNVRLKVRAMVTPRVGKGVAWMPFHFAGHWMGEDRRFRYPPGNDPIVLGESANTAVAYGYDPVTQMQETKVSLCRIEKA